MKKQIAIDLINKLTKAMHLNEKLCESALGVDGTIHQCIGEELASVVNTLKHTKQSN
jgi:hypothetical protein